MSLSALIFGAGPRIGQAVALKLKAEGYKVALASRNPNVEEAKKDGYYPVQVDAAKPETIQGVYNSVEKEIGTPNVVIFNVAALTLPPNPQDPLSVPLSSYINDQNVGANSLFALAQSAVAGFDKLPAAIPRAFIVTGNLLPYIDPIPVMLTLGPQKVVDVYLVKFLNQVYGQKGYRFYYAHQVASSGGLPGKELAGEAHATAYWHLIQRKELGGWDYRFIKDGSAF